jgi:hypothetical protein
VFFHRFYTLQSVKTKREVAKAAKAAKKAREEERDEMDNAEGLGSDEEGDVDEFLEKEEGVSGGSVCGGGGGGRGEEGQVLGWQSQECGVGYQYNVSQGTTMQ